jgi:hypothetical protein
MLTIVSQQSLQSMLDSPNRQYVINVVGRALVALFERQTREEQATDDTHINNNIGFTGADARSGSLTAKSYLKNKTLADWQVERWLKRAKNGYSRLTKYHKQLNEIAVSKQVPQ